MGLFSRRRDDATTDSDESVFGRDLGDNALDEAAASGPWDLSELPEDQEEVPRIDLGSLQVPAVDGMQLRLEQAPDGTVTAVVLALGGSALELRAFAAPRTAGIWDELRGDLANAFKLGEFLGVIAKAVASLIGDEHRVESLEQAG